MLKVRIGDIYMLTKDEFVKIIKRLQISNDVVDKINDIFCNARESIVMDFMNASALSISFEDIVVDLLEKIFNDEDSCWISYFIYELDYGRKYEDGCVRDYDDTIIDLSTAEKLYDFLINKEGICDESN